MMTGCQKQDAQKDSTSDGTNSSSTAAEDETVIGKIDETEDMMKIDTKYGTLKFPAKWKDEVDVSISEDEPYTVSFVTKGTDKEIFSLHFGGGEGYLLGTLPLNGENIEVFVEDAELDAKSKDFDKLCEIQEDVNVILNRLTEDYAFSVGGASKPTEASEDVYAIKTAQATLYYPSRWKDKVEIKEKGNAVAFFSKDVEVFELQFGGKDGFSVGTYDGKDLRLVTFDFNDYKDDKARFEELCTMQEDANTILLYLADDSKFVAA